MPFDLSTPDRSKGPDERASEAETIERGRQVLRELGEDCRQVIRMRAFEGLSYREVAARLGKSEGAARNIMYRCLQKAREILEALDRGSPRSGTRGG